MRTLLSWLDYLTFERGRFSIQMSPNSSSNILRANEVERLGTLPEGDGEQSGFTGSGLPKLIQLLPSSCPKMELNAGTWRDLSHLQFYGSQTLAPAKDCVAETPGELA